MIYIIWIAFDLYIYVHYCVPLQSLYDTILRKSVIYKRQIDIAVLKKDRRSRWSDWDCTWKRIEADDYTDDFFFSCITCDAHPGRSKKSVTARAHPKYYNTNGCILFVRRFIILRAVVAISSRTKSRGVYNYILFVRWNYGIEVIRLMNRILTELRDLTTHSSGERAKRLPPSIRISPDPLPEVDWIYTQILYINCNRLRRISTCSTRTNDIIFWTNLNLYI